MYVTHRAPSVPLFHRSSQVGQVTSHLRFSSGESLNSGTFESYYNAAIAGLKDDSRPFDFGNALSCFSQILTAPLPSNGTLSSGAKNTILACITDIQKYRSLVLSDSFFERIGQTVGLVSLSSSIPNQLIESRKLLRQNQAIPELKILLAITQIAFYLEEHIKCGSGDENKKGLRYSLSTAFEYLGKDSIASKNLLRETQSVLNAHGGAYISDELSKEFPLTELAVPVNSQPVRSQRPVAEKTPPLSLRAGVRVFSDTDYRKSALLKQFDLEEPNPKVALDKAEQGQFKIQVTTKLFNADGSGAVNPTYQNVFGYKALKQFQSANGKEEKAFWRDFIENTLNWSVEEVQEKFSTQKAPVSLYEIATLPPVNGGGLSDIAGLDDFKRQIVKSIIIPALFQGVGEQSYERPNGLLFYGMEGTGKTYFAKKIAEQLGYPIIRLDLTEVGSSSAHETTKAIRDKIDEAKVKSPSVLLIDEFDSIAVKRNEVSPGHQHKLDEANVLLPLLDELGAKGVLAIATTNHYDRLDGPMIRDGRFDHHKEIPLPDLSSRKAIFQYWLKGKAVENREVVCEQAAKETESFTPAQIKSICRNAADIDNFTDNNCKVTLEIILKTIQNLRKKPRKA